MKAPCNPEVIHLLFVQFCGRLFGRRKGSATALAAIGLSTLLVGTFASVVRATEMGALVLIGSQLKRRIPQIWIRRSLFGLWFR